MSRRNRTCPPGATAALVVEGGDEERLCGALLSTQPIFYKTLEGHDETSAELGALALKNDPGWAQIHHVGVVLDAEEDLAASAALAALIFARLNLPVPSKPGHVEEHAGRRLGYFLLPDNHATGSAETLLRRAAEPPVSSCVDAFYQCTPPPGSTQAQRDKAWIGAYAAARTGVGRLDQLFGTKPAFDPSNQAFDPLRAFLIAICG